MEASHTLKPAAVHRPVAVDGAPVVLAEKPAAPGDVGQDALDRNRTALPLLDGHVHRERCELPPLHLPFQQHGVIVTVLPATRRSAQVARAVAEDGKAENQRMKGKDEG